MLVIVEHRWPADPAKLSLDLETVWSFDVLHVDGGEDWGQLSDKLDDLVWVLLLQAEGHHVHSSEHFEENTLAFHNWHTSQSPDVSKAEDGCSVGDNRTVVPSECQVVS